MFANRRSSLVLAGIALLAVLWAAWQGVHAQDKAPAAKPAFVVNLTAGKEDLHKATMALQLANHAIDDGRAVTVFLNVRAPELALKSAPKEWAFGGNPPVGAMLATLGGRGATVLVCPSCLEATGHKPEELVEGTKLASRESLFGALEPGATVFSY